jgi:ATP-dependent DNA helicase RecQ
VLLAGHEDQDIQDHFRSTAFPNEHDVNAVLRALAEYDGLTLRALEEHLNLRKGQLEKVLKVLSVE